MKKIKIVFIAILLCLYLTASHAQANGCYYGRLWSRLLGFTIALLWHSSYGLAKQTMEGTLEGECLRQPSSFFITDPSESINAPPTIGLATL